MLFQTTDDHDTLSVFSVFEFPKHSHYMCIISLDLHINIFINPVILWYKNKKLRPRQWQSPELHSQEEIEKHWASAHSHSVKLPLPVCSDLQIKG